eukprot:scaffold6121_cov170-Amphora_coffeaeformis.AAC.11
MRLLSWIWALHVAVSLAALVPPYSMGSTMYAAAEPTDNSDTPPSSAVHVSYKLESNHPHERICLGDHTTQDDSSSISSRNNGSSFTCTTRAEQISREQERQDPYHWGVDQRIDGSNTEKELIRDVISMMQQYFMDEVLVKPAYKDVRHNWYVHVRACDAIRKTWTSIEKNHSMDHSSEGTSNKDERIRWTA